jgi:hypothetical protein
VPAIVRRMLRFLVKENSLYLLSGFSLLLGYYLCIDTTNPAAQRLAGDLGLLSVFKIYELLVVLFACAVFRRLRVINDGILLGCMGVTLLLDPTLFNTRFYSVSRGVGLAVNGACFALALANLLLLARVGKLPISGRAVWGVGGAAALIYFSGAIFDIDFSGLRPGAPATQDHLYYLVCWAPFIIAAIARRWNEPETECRVPATYAIYQRYLDVVLVVFPLLLSIRHIYSMQDIFSVQGTLANAAPALLAFALLVHNFNPNVAHRAPLIYVLVGSVSLLWSKDFSAATGPLPTIAPYWGIALVNVILGLALYFRTRRVIYAHFCWVAIGFWSAGATMTQTLHSICTLDPTMLAWICLSTVGLAGITGEASLLTLAGFDTILLWTRHSGLEAQFAGLLLISRVATWFLVTGYLYPDSYFGGHRKALTAAALAPLMWVLHGDAAVPAWFEVYYFGEVALILWLDSRGSHAGVKPLTVATTGAHIGLRCYARLNSGAVIQVARNLGGASLILLAFAGLFAGLFVSTYKDRILAALEDDQNP